MIGTIKRKIMANIEIEERLNKESAPDYNLVC